MAECAVQRICSCPHCHNRDRSFRSSRIHARSNTSRATLDSSSALSAHMRRTSDSVGLTVATEPVGIQFLIVAGTSKGADPSLAPRFPDEIAEMAQSPCLILGCLTCSSPSALHLPHTLFLLRHKNTQQDRYNKSNSENTG